MDDHVADLAVVDPLDRLGVARVVAAVQAGDQAQALLPWPGRRPSCIVFIPAGSMPCGFSTNTCLPAWIAVRAWSGWNLAALAITTTSDASITLLVAVEAGEAVVVIGHDLVAPFPS